MKNSLNLTELKNKSLDELKLELSSAKKELTVYSPAFIKALYFPRYGKLSQKRRVISFAFFMFSAVSHVAITDV